MEPGNLDPPPLNDPHSHGHTSQPPAGIFSEQQNAGEREPRVQWAQKELQPASPRLHVLHLHTCHTKSRQISKDHKHKNNNPLDDSLVGTEGLSI